MIFRKLDTSGDWTFGKGKSNFTRDEAAIEENIQTRLLSWVGNCFWDIYAGIDWINRLNKGQERRLINEIVNNLLQAYGVVSVESVSVSSDVATRSVVIHCVNVQTIYGSTFTKTIQQAAGVI